MFLRVGLLFFSYDVTMTEERRGKVSIISGSKILAGNLYDCRDLLQKYSAFDNGFVDVCCHFLLSSQADLTVCSTNGKNLIIANFAHILT